MPIRISALDLLSQIVELRRAIRETREPIVRERVRNVEVSLRSALGPSIPKTAAARALGVSVTALDKWIARGVLPVVTRRGRSRHEVETTPFLDLLHEVAMVREDGIEHGVVAAAVRRLRWQEDPLGRRVLSEELARMPRPNLSVHELRADFEQSTSEQRVIEAAGLSRVATAIAAGRRERR